MCSSGHQGVHQLLPKADSTARKFRLERFEDGELVYLLSQYRRMDENFNKWKPAIMNPDLQRNGGELIIGNGKGDRHNPSPHP